MPRGRRLLEKAFVKTQKAKQDIIEYIPGILGFYLNGSEIVKVPNREGYVFVRIRNNLSEVVKAYNDDVPPIFDLPVYIFRDPKDKRKWRISGKNVGTYREWNDDPYLPQHGEKHSFRGGDVTWIYSEQLLPLMALPSGTSTSGGLLVHGRYPYYWNNEWKYFSTTGTANLLDYKPTGTFNKTVLIYLDQSTNELGYEEGGYFAENITGAAQVVQHLPSLSESYYTPIAGVRLTSGTSSFTWDNLYDVRPWLNDLDNTTGSSSGHTIQEDGVNQTQRTNLNFIGDGFEVWDDAGNNATIVSGTSSSSGGGHTIQEDDVGLEQRTNLNFVGDLFELYDDAGSDATIVSGTLSASPEYITKWFVSNEIGNDENTGLYEDDALATVDKALENCSEYDLIDVLDSNTYTLTSPIIIPDKVTVNMPFAELKGEINLGNNSRFIAKKHTPSDDGQTMVSCIGTLGSAYTVYGMSSVGYSNIIHFKPAAVGGYVVANARHITVGSSTIGNENILVYSTAGSIGVNIATDGAKFSSDKVLNYGYPADLVYGDTGYAQWYTDVVGYPITITYDIGTGTTVSSYKMKATSSGTRMPKNWTVYGQLADAGWELLDTQEDITWDSYEEKEFDIVTPDSYDEYKIVIASSTHATRLQIDDIGLIAGIASVGGDIMVTADILSLGEYAQGILSHDASQRVITNINNIYQISGTGNATFIDMSNGTVSHSGGVVTADTIWNKAGGVLIWNVAFDSGGVTGSSTLEIVNTMDAQTIAGIKTFSSFPITPSEAPDEDYEVANKKYVDDNISAVSSGTHGNDFHWHLEGSLSPLLGVGANWVVPRDGTIEKAIFYVEDTGITGSTIVDINKNGGSIFVTPPEIPFNDADGIVTATPDTLDLSSGDLITFDIDSAASGSSGLDVYVAMVGGGGGSSSSLTVEEEDGSPSVSNVDTIKFSNGTVTDNGDGSVSIFNSTGSSGGGASILSDTYANIPTGTAINDGDLFLPTDGMTLEYATGSAWSPWGVIFPFTRPVLTDFTWVNQGTATADDSNGGIYLLAPAVNGDQMRILKKAAPSTPYTITVALLTHMYKVNYNTIGILWRQSSDGKIARFSWSSNELASSKFNSPTSWNSTYIDEAISFGFGVLWLRIEDDGTYRKCHWSVDGYHFHELHSVGRTDFITADEIGFVANSNNATYPAGMTLLSWKEE